MYISAFCGLRYYDTSNGKIFQVGFYVCYKTAIFLPFSRREKGKGVSFLCFLYIIYNIKDVFLFSPEGDDVNFSCINKKSYKRSNERAARALGAEGNFRCDRLPDTCFCKQVAKATAEPRR